MDNHDLLLKISSDIATLMERTENFVTRADFATFKEQAVTKDDLAQQKAEIKVSRNRTLATALAAATVIATVLPWIITT